MRSNKPAKPVVFHPSHLPEGCLYVGYGEDIIAVIRQHGVKHVEIERINTGEDIDGRSVFVAPRSDLSTKLDSIDAAVKAAVNEWLTPIGVTS